eukprot:562003-Pyramimonas_sp.AAC.1
MGPEQICQNRRKSASAFRWPLQKETERRPPPLVAAQGAQGGPAARARNARTSGGRQSIRPSGNAPHR